MIRATKKTFLTIIRQHKIRYLGLWETQKYEIFKKLSKLLQTILTTLKIFKKLTVTLTFLDF